jgi:hypothetical protein
LWAFIGGFSVNKLWVWAVLNFLLLSLYFTFILSQPEIQKQELVTTEHLKSSDEKQGDILVTAAPIDSTSKTPDNQEESQDESMDQVVDILMNIVDQKGGTDSVQQVINIVTRALANDQKKKQELREELFSFLPLNVQNAISKEQSEYKLFLSRVCVGTGLLDIANVLSDLFSFYKNSDPLWISTEQLCIKLKNSLSDGSFVALFSSSVGINPLKSILYGKMGPDNFSSLVKMIAPDYSSFKESKQEKATSPAVALTAQDCVTLAKALKDIAPLVKTTIPEVTFKNINSILLFLSDLLDSLLKRDIKRFLNLYISFVESSARNICISIDQAIKIIEENSREILEKDKSKIKLYNYWLKELKEHKQTLNIYLSLSKDSLSGLPETERFFPMIAYAYDVVKEFVYVYQCELSAAQENNILFMTNLLDWGFTAVLSTWYFFVYHSQDSRGELYNILLTGGNLKEFESDALLIKNIMLFIPSFFVLLKPSIWQQQPSRLIHRCGSVLVAWIYYHLFHCKLFGKEPFFFGCENNSGKIWPNNYYPFKSAILDLLKEVTREIKLYGNLKMCRAIAPETWEQIEGKSLGILRPEVMGFAIETLIPLILFKFRDDVQRVVALKPDEIFPTTASVMNTRATVRWGAGATSLEKCYLEYSFVSHLCSSIARFTAAHYKRTLSSLIYKVTRVCAKGLAWVGLVDKDTVDYLSEVSEGVEIMWSISSGYIKTFFSEVFTPGFPARNQLINFLKHYNYIKESDLCDEMASNRKIARVILDTLLQWRFLSYADAARIIKLCEAPRLDVSQFVDRIVEGVKDSLLEGVWGWLGDWTGQLGAWGLERKWGPFYPYVTRCVS